MRMEPEFEGIWSVTCLCAEGLPSTGTDVRARRSNRRVRPAGGCSRLEGYPTEPTPGKTLIWDDTSVGLLQVFIDAGYEVAASPTLRRRVVRHRLGATS